MDDTRPGPDTCDGSVTATVTVSKQATTITSAWKWRTEFASAAVRAISCENQQHIEYRERLLDPRHQTRSGHLRRFCDGYSDCLQASDNNYECLEVEDRVRQRCGESN